jgi:hypothetical protein
MPQCKAAITHTVKLGTGPFDQDITPDAEGAAHYVFGSATDDLSSIIDYRAVIETVETTWESMVFPIRYTRTICQSVIRDWQSEENELDFLDCFPSED